MRPRAALACLAILVLALALRLHGAGRDVPIDLEPTNAPAQDAFWYLEAAQAPADGSQVEPLGSYDRPLWVLLARGWFAAFGTGVESAQRLSAVVSSLGVVGVFLALRRAKPRAAVLGALLLATSYPFCGMARTPLIYSPLAALMGLALALHAREEAWARGVAWLLLLALVGAFKSVALVAAPGFALADLARLDRRNRAVSAVVGAVAVAVPLVALARMDPHELLRNEERIRRYLLPDAGWGSWRSVVLAPVESGLVLLAPGLLGLAAVGATRWRQPLVLASLGWVATLLGGLALSSYRPLRFYMLAGPPLAVLAGVGADALLAGGRRSLRAPLVAGLVVANAWALLSPRLAPAPLRALGAPFGLGVALLLGTGFGPALRLPSRPLAALLLALTLGLDLARDLALSPGTLVEANGVARAVLGPRALLAGPYASSLAAGARGLERRRAPDLRGGPFAAEGLALARSRGFTHVALDEKQEASGQLASGFARLGAPPVLLLELRVRNEAVLLYRLQAAGEAGYELSAIERAFEAPDQGAALRAAGGSEALIAARARALERLGRGKDARALMGTALK